MRRHVYVLGLAVAAALLVPSAAQADSGTISGASISPSGTTVSVVDLSVDVSCGSSPIGTYYCGAMAGVIRSTSGSCPASGSGSALPAGLVSMWDVGWYISSHSLDSGARSVSVPGPAAYRVCLYSKYMRFDGAYPSHALLDSVDLPAPPVSSQPGGTTKTKCKKHKHRKKCKGRGRTA